MNEMNECDAVDARRLALIRLASPAVLFFFVICNQTEAAQRNSPSGEFRPRLSCSSVDFLGQSGVQILRAPACCGVWLGWWWVGLVQLPVVRPGAHILWCDPRA